MQDADDDNPAVIRELIDNGMRSVTADAKFVPVDDAPPRCSWVQPNALERVEQPVIVPIRLRFPEVVEATFVEIVEVFVGAGAKLKTHGAVPSPPA